MHAEFIPLTMASTQSRKRRPDWSQTSIALANIVNDRLVTEDALCGDGCAKERRVLIRKNRRLYSTVLYNELARKLPAELCQSLDYEDDMATLTDKAADGAALESVTYAAAFSVANFSGRKAISELDQKWLDASLDRSHIEKSNPFRLPLPPKRDSKARRRMSWFLSCTHCSASCRRSPRLLTTIQPRHCLHRSKRRCHDSALALCLHVLHYFLEAPLPSARLAFLSLTTVQALAPQAVPATAVLAGASALNFAMLQTGRTHATPPTRFVPPAKVPPVASAEEHEAFCIDM